MADDLWAELFAADRLFYARYPVERFGDCPICGLGATDLLLFPLGVDNTTVPNTWAACKFCSERWPTDAVLRPNRLRLHDDMEEAGIDPRDCAEIENEVLYDSLQEFAHFTQSRESMMTTKKQGEAPRDLDLIGRADVLDTLLSAIEKRATRDDIERVRAAHADLLDAATCVLFARQLTPAPDAVLRDFDLAVHAAAVLPYERIEGALAAIHEESIDCHPDLAALVRGPRGQRLVRLHARNAAAGDPAAAMTAEQTAVATFIALIVPQLRSREAAELAKRQEAEAAERATREAAERAEEQQRRAERLRAESRDDRDRRESLAEFYKRHGRYRFQIDGRSMFGQEAAAALLEGAEYLPYYRSQFTGQRVRTA